MLSIIPELLLTTVLVAGAAYFYELIFRNILLIKDMSNSKDHLLYWVQNGWSVIKCLLNINLGVLLLLFTFILALRCYQPLEEVVLAIQILFLLWYSVVFKYCYVWSKKSAYDLF